MRREAKMFRCVGFVILINCVLVANGKSHTFAEKHSENPPRAKANKVSPENAGQHQQSHPHLGHPVRGSFQSNSKPTNHGEQDTACRTEEPWRVCYYTNWSQYRPAPGTFWPEDMDPSLCTHIYYAFSDMFENRLAFYEINDIDLYGRINAWKQQHPTLKTVLSVGGWTHGTAQMTLMLASKANRTEFIVDVISTLTEYNFNGIDLHFEYPGGRGSPAEDKYLYTCLVKEMRTAFDNHNAQNPTNPFLMTAGVPADNYYIENGYEIEAVSTYLDKVILMAFGFQPARAYSGYTFPHSALSARPDLSFPEDNVKNAETAVSLWLSGGCPRHKLVLGLATHGGGFTLLNPLLNGLEAPTEGRSDSCNFTRTLGFCAYYELCYFWEPGATITFDPFFRVPWGYNGDQWFGYENTESFVGKVDYVINEKLGGVMIWSMDGDDFSVSGMFCQQGRYPLTKAVSLALIGYTVPNPPVVLPDPDFCIYRPDGFYEDPDSCERYYYCVSGTTNPASCPAGTIYDPAFIGCRDPADLSQVWICENCIDYCERVICDT